MVKCESFYDVCITVHTIWHESVHLYYLKLRMTNFAFSRQACTVNLFFFPSTFWDVMLYDHAVNLETL